MPCAVPYCDPEGQSFSLRFPRSTYLYERWRQAIELGSGLPFPDDTDPMEAEICQQHFNEVDEYSEPIIFQNQCLGREVHLSSCRLCLRFDFVERIVPHWEQITIGDVTIEELLKNAFKIPLTTASDPPAEGVCEECLARLDLVVTIRRQFFESAKCLRKMEIFIKEENRLRYRKVAKPDQMEAVVVEVVEQLNSSEILSEVSDIVLEIAADAKLTEALNDTDFVTEEINEDEFDEDEYVLEEHEENDDNEDDDYIPEEEVAEEIEAPPEHPKAKRVRRRKKSQSDEERTEKRSVGRPRGKSVRVPKEKIPLKGLTERKCYMCVQLFETAEELFAHMVAHLDHNLDCDACGLTFPNLTKYNRHLAKHDPVERPVKCDHCELRFTDGLGKRRHEKQKHNIDHPVSMFTYADRRKGKFTCQHCGKQCLSMSFLKEHEDAHAGIKRHECKSCGRLFANKNNLERHHLIHTSEKPYKCNICGKAFRQSPMYKDHLRLHSGETPYTCNGCEMQFTSTTLLRKHKIRFHGASSSQTKTGLSAPRTHNYCRFCFIPFKRHSLLIDHIERFHRDEEIEYFRCHICEQRFVDKPAFDVHVRNHDKNFQCEYCDKAFSSLQALKMHEPIHDGVRGFSCKTCSKSFTHVANLKRHELLHLGIKRHECDFCGKRFAQSNQLHTHRRTHTGEKPYECHKCGKRFADNSTLCKHRKSVCKPV